MRQLVSVLEATYRRRRVERIPSSPPGSSHVTIRFLAELLIIVVMGVICLSCRSTIPPTVPDVTPSLVSGPAKQVISTTLPFVEKWRWSGLIHNLFGPPIVVISEERIIIATRAGFGDNKIIAFDAHTGKPLWESELISNLGSLYASNGRVYVGTIRSVRAYDLETGQLLWEGAEQSKFKRGKLSVYPGRRELNVYDSHDGHLYLLDPETGQILKENRISNLFFKEDDIYYVAFICGPNCVNARDVLSGESLWTHDFGGRIYSWPVFIKDKMFINTEEQIFALEAVTGDVIWRFTEGNFVSNLAQGNSTLYVIRNDAAVIGLDPETGDELGIIEMAPVQDLTYRGGYAPYYVIAASNQFLAAYYSNSQELIVFERALSVNEGSQ